MVVRSRLANFNREQEEAAKDLGASEWQVFRDVLIPHIKPALIAGALLSFTLSLDDFVITYFTSGPDTITFPVKGLFDGPFLGDARGQRCFDPADHPHRHPDLRRAQAPGRESHCGNPLTMTDTARPIIQIQNVSKRFGRVTAVDNVSLDINAGEFFVLLGPSGCGKTTLLRMIAGFELPTEGKVLIDGQDMAGIPPNKRPVNMVFQSYAVFPHMSVADNVAYGLKIAGVKGGEVKDRVAEALELVKLGGFESRHARPDVGRPAPARRARAQPRHAAESAAARRTAVGARREAARADAVRTQRTSGKGRHHLRHRDARPG